MCDKAVDNYPHELEFVSECCKSQRMCNKAVDKCTFLFPINTRLKKCVRKSFL